MPQPEALGTLAVQLRQVMAQADASLDLGGMQDIVLRSSSQLCVLYPIAPMATLVVTCQTDKTLGMVHWACRDAVERIEAILRQEEAG
jgi:predicted regulator of Ras-like GTPase activity (Roadblock/LC7/MglB family)